MTRPNVNNGRCGLGGLAGRLELGLDDGRLAQRHGLGRGYGVAGGQLGGRSRRLERRRQVAWPLLRHLVVAGIEELLPLG